MIRNLLIAAISSTILSLAGVNAYADSPLTSTYFHEAYDDLPTFDSDSRDIVLSQKIFRDRCHKT